MFFFFWLANNLLTWQRIYPKRQFINQKFGETKTPEGPSPKTAKGPISKTPKGLSPKQDIPNTTIKPQNRPNPKKNPRQTISNATHPTNVDQQTPLSNNWDVTPETCLELDCGDSGSFSSLYFTYLKQNKVFCKIFSMSFSVVFVGTIVSLIYLIYVLVFWEMKVLCLWY